MNAAPRQRGFIGALDRALGWLVAAAMWLVLPLALLLFLQWPLRDLVQWGSREANDAAQCLFAVFVAVAITAATRARLHLASDAFAHRLRAPARRKLAALALVVGVLPWSLYMLVAGAPDVWQSLRQLERFPDTFNPGYFIVKASAALLALCVALQALVDLFAPGDASADSPPAPRSRPPAAP